MNEDGSLKEGVETGVPFHLMGEEERERYEMSKNGEEGEGNEESVDEKRGEGYVDTSADDVD